MFVSSFEIQAVLRSYDFTMARYERAHYQLLKYSENTIDEIDFYQRVLDAKKRKAINLAKAKANAWHSVNARLYDDAYSSGVILETE